jgi:hypothetical protein
MQKAGILLNDWKINIIQNIVFVKVVKHNIKCKKNLLFPRDSFEIIILCLWLMSEDSDLGVFRF